MTEPKKETTKTEEELTAKEVDLDDYLHNLTTVENLKPIYSKPKIVDSGSATFGKEFTLWQGKPNTIAHPPILIIDTDGFILPGKQKYCLQRYDGNFEHIWSLLPKHSRREIEKIGDRWFPIPPDPFNATLFANMSTVWSAIPTLKDPSIVFKIDWLDFVENQLLSFKAKKDPRIKLVYKATVPRSVEIRYAPHSLVCTGTDTGKSEFFDRAGIRKDKITAGAFIGTKNKDITSYGIVHNQELPICIEQIESQDAEGILRFLYSFMEFGKASHTTAYGDISAEGKSTIVITANPTGYDINHVATFRNLIDVLTKNYLAMGRRFGLLLYGGEDFYKKVTSTPGVFDDSEWTKRVAFFRAVEEYSYPVSVALYKEKRIRSWLETPIDKYADNVKDLTTSIEDKAVQQFLQTHGGGGYRHTRGGALNCARIDFMPELVKLKSTAFGDFPDVRITEILNMADEYLARIVQSNLEAIGNIPKVLEKESLLQQIIYERMPKYVREILLTVKVFKETAVKCSMEIDDEVPFSALKASHQKIHYPYWSNVESSLKLSNIEVHNLYLDNYFGFRIAEKTSGIYAVSFTQKNKEIKVP